MIQDNSLEIMFENVDGWRAFEVNDGIGLSQASALRELPYDLDPDRAPFAKELYWEDSSLRVIITPTRDALTEFWVRYNIEPIILMAAPASAMDPDEMKYVKSSYKMVSKIQDTNGSNGEVYYLSKEEHEESNLTRHSVICVFEESDVQVSFSFTSSILAEDEEVLAETLPTLAQIANNFLKSPALDVFGAAQRATKGSADIAFEYSVTGQFVSDPDNAIYPIKGLDGWKLYAHTGNAALIGMLSMESLEETPADIANRNSNKIFEITKDATDEVGLDWRDSGMQLFAVPPLSEEEAVGVTPLLITISISNEMVTPAVSSDYDVIYDDGEVSGGIQVLAFAPSESMFDDESDDDDEEDDVELFDHSYVATVFEHNCSVTAIAISKSVASPRYYDDAFVSISRTIAEHVQRIAVEEA